MEASHAFIRDANYILMAKVLTPRRRIGRPPAGAREGEKVKDYPQLSIRLPGDVKAKLLALSVLTRRPQWRLITDAIECFLRELPDSEQRMISELVGRSRTRKRKTD